MNQYLQSNAKSVMSIDEGKVELKDISVQTYNWQSQESCIEIERLGRKINFLEKSKMMVQEEMNFYQEENESLKKKIRQIQQTISSNIEIKEGYEKYTLKTEIQSMEVILNEKEEELEITKTVLQERDKQCQMLLNENWQLRQEVQSKNKTLQKIKQSTVAQSVFLKAQTERLKEQLDYKNQVLAEKQLLFDCLLRKQTEKWEKINQSLTEELQKKNFEIEKLTQKLNQEQKLREKYVSIEDKLKSQLGKQKQKNDWLQRLMEQAKEQFIHTTLLQQEQKQKMQKEKKELQKRTKWLKNRLKGQKIQQGSTAAPSSKSTCKSSRISKIITPFRLKQQSNELNSLNQSQFFQINFQDEQ